MSDIRVMMLWVAVHLAALSFGAWLVLRPGAALLLASPALLLAAIAIPIPRRWLGLQ